MLLAGVVPALISALGTGVYFVGVGKSAREVGWFLTAIGIRVIMSIALGLSLGIRKVVRTQVATNGAVPWIFLVAAVVFDVLGFSLYNIAVQSHHVSYVSAITSAASLVTILLSWLCLKEKLARYQLAGALLIVAGLVLVQF